MTPAELVPKLQTAWVWISPWLHSRTVQTIVLVVAIGALRSVVGWRIRRWPFSADERRRWLVTARNAALILLIAGLVVVWNQPLQTLMLSVVALGAAGVLALKEFILCLSGALYRTISEAFRVGDRIEINGLRGDVIDHGPLSTTLLEVGPGSSVHQLTGRAVVVPNSWLLLHSVINETFTDAYVLHPFVVAIPRSGNWKGAERRLLDASNRECAPFLEDARAFFGKQVARHSLQNIAPEPRVAIRLGDPTKIEFLVRIPVPARQKSRHEQAILHRFLAEEEDGEGPVSTPVQPPLRPGVPKEV